MIKHTCSSNNTKIIPTTRTINQHEQQFSQHQQQSLHYQQSDATPHFSSCLSPPSMTADPNECFPSIHPPRVVTPPQRPPWLSNSANRPFWADANFRVTSEVEAQWGKQLESKSVISRISRFTLYKNHSPSFHFYCLF